ncbi:MAG: hypothetical protein Q4G25_14035 [Paracoccus sp. (in: a-proteobacteria)]|nr:hypothetical protein [Paracoccus sp. (in: a-proteobacteria)]
MRRYAILFLATLLALSVAGNFWLLTQFGRNFMQRVDQAGINAHLEAEIRLLTGAAMQSCLTREDFTAAAHDLGWSVEAVPTAVDDSLYHPSLPQALHIGIRPGIPFGKLDYRIFQFDAGGCFARLPH